MIQKDGAEWDERVGRTREQGAGIEKGLNEKEKRIKRKKNKHKKWSSGINSGCEKRRTEELEIQLKEEEF